MYARAFPSTCKLENSKIVRNGHQHTRTAEDEKVLWINVCPPIEKHSNKDLKTTIHLTNSGRSIKVPSISCFVIMNFNFGYVYMTTYKLKAYVYMLEIILWWSDKLMSLDVWHWTAGWNAHHIGFLGSINCNLTNTSSTSPLEVKKQ